MAISLVKAKTAKSWYTLQGQEQEADPAKFEVRPLTPDQYTEVVSHVAQDNLGKALNKAFALGVTNWSGVTDEEGKPKPCKHKFFSDIPSFVKQEVGGHVVSISELEEEEIKN